MLFLMLFSVNVFATPVNINKASAEEIAEALKGIGHKKALAIVDYRKQVGTFKDAGELTAIKGIGQKTLENNLQDIKLSDKK